MPLKKQKFEEIKKAVIWEIEGMNALGIAKALTQDNLTKLWQEKIIRHPKTLQTLVAINKNRCERDNITDIIEDMREKASLQPPQIKDISHAIVHPKRIRSLMKSELWNEYKEAFHKEHIEQIAKAEATKFVNKTYNSK